MDGLETWDVARPRVYSTFGEAVNAFAVNIYRGWVWRLENVIDSDVSDEEITAMSNFRDWVYYGNDVSADGAFELFIRNLSNEVVNTVETILEDEVFMLGNFYQNGSLYSVNYIGGGWELDTGKDVILKETQQKLTDLEPEIKTNLEQKGLSPLESLLILSLNLNYYDGYETDERCNFRVYRIGGSQ